MIPPLSAETIFYIAGFPVTNAIINSWIAVVFFVVFALIVTRKREMVPRGLQNVFEWIMEVLMSFAEQVTGDKDTAMKYFPIAATIFVFVLFSNWIGLMPGTGSIGVYQLHHGHVELIPLLRPAGSDLNLTLAIAGFSIFMTHIFGIIALGTWKHFNKFINIMGIVHSFKKGPMAIVVAFIEFGVGVIELVGEVAKTVSLSLRLFGNIFAGEVLLTVLAGIMAYGLPIPFMFLELLVGIIQASVFAILFLAFATVATMDLHAEEEAH
ncbi:F0F1 ATP synthase subunit A [Candidatus Uhrbacteria bacterium]|jgi:F-type H+-transporting ATPase subunit a|nr:F0F1 ATP synthase subunit A [Candidatus Uhrbacteria bacterium]